MVDSGTRRRLGVLERSVWENSWAAPFASAARRSGGQLIANGRIPIQAIVASLEAEDALQSQGD